MIKTLGFVDLSVAILLLLFLVGMSMYASLKKKSAESYFMAGRNLKWYSVAGSIFGTNIHAQQIIGMMGIGYSIGFVQSHYEVLAVPAILILAYLFIPLYRKRKVFTLSQFLESRYNANTRLAYAIIMIVFILINLIAGFYIGSRTLGLLFAGSTMEISYLTGILIIAGVTILFTVFGGMESVVIADNILTVLMILSILFMGIFTYSQPEIKGIIGLITLDREMPHELQKIHLYLPANHPKLPWSGIFTGLIILQFFYWTTNQYQVQRVLAAETDREAKLGTIAAGFLKLLIPFFSIMVGVAAFYLFKARLGEGLVQPDDTFIKVLEMVVPVGYGITGLVLAGLICAIFSAIYSMMNSATTMLAFDVYKKYLKPSAEEKETVRFGQWMVVLMCIVAVFFAYTTYEPNSSENFFLILADRLSYLKPGLVVIFFWGIFWKFAHPRAAFLVLICSPFIGFGLDYLYNNFLGHIPFVGKTFGEELSFLYRVFLLTFVGSIVMYLLSKYFNATDNTSYNQDTLGVSLESSGKNLLIYFGLQLPFCLAGLLHLLDVRYLAPFAAAAAIVPFVRYIKESESILKSDFFYASLLTASMTFILFFFA
jgi:solute:Na+ symporter, SSS family